jgi:hypothetical protein
MDINILIIIGIILILFAVLFALPFFGIGMIIPFLGDVIDIPVSIVFALAGIALLIIGGLLQILVQFWWVLAIILSILILLNVFKIRIKVMT